MVVAAFLSGYVALCAFFRLRFARDELTNLQYHGDDDEREHEVVEGVLVVPHLQHVLQLRGVGREQRHVQQTLRYRLLCRIAIRVEGLPLKEILKKG